MTFVIGLENKSIVLFTRNVWSRSCVTFRMDASTLSHQEKLDHSLKSVSKMYSYVRLSRILHIAQLISSLPILRELWAFCTIVLKTRNVEDSQDMSWGMHNTMNLFPHIFCHDSCLMLGVLLYPKNLHGALIDPGDRSNRYIFLRFPQIS